MNFRKRSSQLLLTLIGMLLIHQQSYCQSKKLPLQVSGIYPHLATFNEGWNQPGDSNCGETGIGAITPWAGKLWMVTYSAHRPNGSADKLYSVDKNMNVTIHPESIGGTPANRMIHKESKQLITSNYFIDGKGNVRTIPFSIMPGRMTATARHLTDPANMVYFYDMEGKLYEANVHTLGVNKLFNKPVPGWHGKGAYTAQKRLVVANNGEHDNFGIIPEDLKAGEAAKSDEDKGVLASWDGKTWQIIERRQFTDVTGPGGIYGSPDDKSPLWTIGWDKRSVILKLLDGGNWYTYRLPKSTHTYDHKYGWYSEWPRIREVGDGKMLMDMHGMMYDFPKTFSRQNSGGILPLNSHLRYIPDFCNWNNQLVIATDETSVMSNPMAGRTQSNLWFGQISDLKTWGGATGWGGPWDQDIIKAGQISDPFLINGFDHKVLHLAQISDHTVNFTMQIDLLGNNKWVDYKTIAVPANKYHYFVLPDDFSATWVRFKTSSACKASAFFHYTGRMHESQDQMFSSIAGINEKTRVNESLIRPSGHNKNLQVLNISNDKLNYQEVNEKLQFLTNKADSTKQMERLLALKKTYTMDDASVIIKDGTGTFRLPGTSAAYETFASRDRREVESERFMLNIQGTFFEVGRESGFNAVRPIATHKKKIIDFCTWRGLLVLSGTKTDAQVDGHYFGNMNGGLWFGGIDDLWKLGKPVGEGGVWKNSAINAGEVSLPYLMTGYDDKSVKISSNEAVNITLQIDFDHTGFHDYKTFALKPGETINYKFPKGFSAHWVRAVADKACRASVWFVYK